MLDIKVWIDGYNAEVTVVIPISAYVIAIPQMEKRFRGKNHTKKD
jgi:hypothetical protein